MARPLRATLPDPAVVIAATAELGRSEFDHLRQRARTARDVQEIENLMAGRAMLHSIGHDQEELDLWSKKQESAGGGSAVLSQA